MKWYAFTRFPSFRFETSLNTEYPAINAFLEQLDQQLVGAKSVRRLTLEEARDHLLEHTESLVDKSKAPPEAAQMAIASFGSPEEHSKVQRKERLKLFSRMATSFGLMFAFLMTIFNVLGGPIEELNLALQAKLFVFYALFYGILMGYWFTFGFAQAKPTQSKSVVDSGDELKVYSGTSSKVAAVFLGLVMGTIGIASILGAIEIGFMQSNGTIVNVLLAILALQMAVGSPVAFGQYLLSKDTLKIQMLGRKEEVPLTSILQIETVAKWKRFFRMRIGEPFIIHWQDGEQEKQTMILVNGEMHNSDQLLANLREQADNSSTENPS